MLSQCTKKALALFGLVILTAGVVSAQYGRGVILGTVTDATGAVLRGRR